MQAVILAAGQGLRLRPHTETTPKPLIEIAGQPLLQYTLEALPDQISEIIIVIGYLGEQIKTQFGDNWQGKTITYVEQTELLGTGDALLQAKPLLHNNFLVVNGDDLYEQADLTEMLDHQPSMLAWDSDYTSKFALSVDQQNNLLGFDENSNTINCGVYHLDQSFFEQPLVTIEVHGSTEYSLPHTLVNLAKAETVKIVKARSWLPVGTPEQLQIARDYYEKK